MAENARAINRIFTRKVIGDLIRNGSSKEFDAVVRQYINYPESKTHGEIIKEIYAFLGKEQRNEYYYINTLLNKLLLGIHSVNTTTALSQVRIGRHIADFVLINEEGQVYEIKSDLDNFDRLYDQLTDYFKAFSKVSVFASEHEYNQIKRILETFGNMGKAVGIYILTKNNTVFSPKYEREPKSFDEYLDYSYIFKLLRKSEYTRVLLQQSGELPQVAPVFYFKECLYRFQQMPIKVAQTLTIAELKKRNKIYRDTFVNIQSELKSTIYFSGLSKKIPDLVQLLTPCVSTVRRIAGVRRGEPRFAEPTWAVYFQE